MKKQIISASAISLASFAASQLIRFAGNIFLAKLLSPSAFGVVAVVNLLILALNLLSDIGMRQIIIQRQGELSVEFVNTIWVMQILRGACICLLSLVCAAGLRLLQIYGLIDSTNSYADPLLPFLIVGAASTAIFQGLESTKLLTERRALSLGRVSGIAFIAQMVAMGLMILIAYFTKSPWALVIGGIAAAFIQFVLSHAWLPGAKNSFLFRKDIAIDVLIKGRWIFLSSMVSFLGGNSDILILGGLIDPASLGNYVVAFQLINVVQILANTISGNVVFPALSAMKREGSAAVERGYSKIQIFSDALVVTAAGVFMTGGGALVHLLFDERYKIAGKILSCLAIGVVGIRYYVVEQMMNADGNFKLTTNIAIFRLLCLVLSTYAGFYAYGLIGAAIAVSISSFAAWPICIWYRTKAIGLNFYSEIASIFFLAVGAGLGWGFSRIIHF